MHMTTPALAVQVVTAMHQMHDGGMHDGGMSSWMWLWMALWGLVGLAVLVLAVVAIVFLIRTGRRMDGTGPASSREVQT